jgi:prepilin-type N-terminal cleavage/methylation domain-containing protein
MNRRGFTLIETLLALAITAVVVAAVGGVVRRAAEGRAAVDQRVEALAGGRLLLGLLADEIEASVPGSFAVEVGESDPGILLALTTSTPDGVPIAVRYRLDGERLLRGTRSPFASGDPPAGEPVLDGVTTLAVDCFDGKGWAPSWRSKRPPEAVALRLQVGGGETLRVTVSPAVRRRA